MKSVMRSSFSLVATLAAVVLLPGCGGGSSESAGTGAAGGGVAGGETAVYPADVRSAVLSWSAPLTRVNGDSIPMGELEQYVIRYGQDAENMTEQVVVTNAQLEAEMAYKVSGLDDGTWYFTIQAQDINGLISQPSEAVSKVVSS